MSKMREFSLYLYFISSIIQSYLNIVNKGKKTFIYFKNILGEF